MNEKQGDIRRLEAMIFLLPENREWTKHERDRWLEMFTDELNRTIKVVDDAKPEDYCLHLAENAP